MTHGQDICTNWFHVTTHLIFNIKVPYARWVSVMDTNNNVGAPHTHYWLTRLALEYTMFWTLNLCIVWVRLMHITFLNQSIVLIVQLLWSTLHLKCWSLENSVVHTIRNTQCSCRGCATSQGLCESHGSHIVVPILFFFLFHMALSRMGRGWPLFH